MPVDTQVDDGMISDPQLLQDATPATSIRSRADHPSTTSSLRATGATPGTVVVLDSCYSTWIFDSSAMRFRRILKGIEFTHRVTTAWRPYWGLDLDPDDDGFTVYLNAGHTRLIRSWRHTAGCAQCQDAHRSSSDLTAGVHW